MDVDAVILAVLDTQSLHPRVPSRRVAIASACCVLSCLSAVWATVDAADMSAQVEKG